MFNSSLFNTSNYNSYFTKVVQHFVEKFFRAYLKRQSTIKIVLKRKGLDVINLERSQLITNLTRIPIKINLKRPRFEFTLQRIGER